ncbi:MAG: hypothetical protein H6923_00625 [Alphaproteobacteria bacterium]|nr:hypothetical protein [Alphaproteobacteria bacterium]
MSVGISAAVPGHGTPHCAPSYGGRPRVSAAGPAPVERAVRARGADDGRGNPVLDEMGVTSGCGAATSHACAPSLDAPSEPRATPALALVKPACVEAAAFLC